MEGGGLTAVGLIGDVIGADRCRYGARDSAGNVMDTLKIIDSPAGGYLGVYHTGDTVNLAVSDDVLTWTLVTCLDDEATQPTIRALPSGGYLTGVEFNTQRGSGGMLRLRHYPDLGALLAGRFDRDRTIPRTLSACNEGTPHFATVEWGSGIDRSVIEVGFHYQRRCDVDRQALGVLSGFDRWDPAADTACDERIMTAAAAAYRRVRGNIGGRDTVWVDGVSQTVYEVQHRRNDFGSWRIYVEDRHTGEVSPVPVSTHGGSTAFANPKVTAIRSPSGVPALAVTLFVPMEGAAPGEAGELIHYTETDRVTIP
jgi:hypothetical protein